MSAHYNSYAIPMPVPNHKGQQYPSYNSTYSVSPPETDESVSSGTGPSYSNSGYSVGYSVANSSYAGSNSGDFESARSASGVDFNDYMQDRFAQTFDPIPLDRNIAVQAQT